MTPDLFREVGEALFGPQWQAELARSLDLSDRTVRRWAAGKWPVPAGIAVRLDALLAARGAEISNIRRRLKAPAPTEN